MTRKKAYLNWSKTDVKCHGKKLKQTATGMKNAYNKCQENNCPKGKNKPETTAGYKIRRKQSQMAKKNTPNGMDKQTV